MLGSRNSKIYRLFPSTAPRGQTKAFLQFTLQSSDYPEFGLLHLLPALVEARWVSSATTMVKHPRSSKGFSTASKALSPHSEECKFCHWLGSEHGSESLACSVLGLHRPSETPLHAPQVWGHINLLFALLQRHSPKTLWVRGSWSALSLHAEVASLAPIFFFSMALQGIQLFTSIFFSLTAYGLSNATVFCVSKCHGGWFGFVKRWWKKGNKAASLRAYS